MTVQAFRSPSDARSFYKDNHLTFVGLAVDADGNCFTVERNATRKGLKAKAIVVRYPNPFLGVGVPEIVHEASKPMSSLVLSGDGALHTVSSDARHHTNESGTWKTHKAGDKTSNDVYRVAASIGEQLYLLGRKTVWRREGGAYHAHVFEQEPWALAGSSRTDVYLCTTQGLFHHGEDGWRIVHGDLIWGSLCPSSGGWLTTARRPGERIVLFEGNAMDGFAPVLTEDAVEDVDDLGPQSTVLRALGKVFLDGKRGVWLVEHGKARRFVVATGWSAAVGNDVCLWVANGTELLCHNGSDWRIVPRVGDN